MTRDVPGAVSLWVGISPSHDALRSYVEIDYSRGGPRKLSQLDDDFGTGRYDEDFMDAWAIEKATRSLRNLLRGCSNDSLIIPKFVELCGEILPVEANSAVVLYDFRHDGKPGGHGPWNAAVKLRYMGTITEDVPWPTSSEW
jgi:hypothetical protein